MVKPVLRGDRFAQYRVFVLEQPGEDQAGDRERRGGFIAHSVIWRFGRWVYEDCGAGQRGASISVRREGGQMKRMRRKKEIDD